MGVVPQLDSSCFCCTLKTGSFVTAWLLLVGSGVQIGFYSFLVDHMNPRRQCTYEETVWVDVDPPAHGYYPPLPRYFIPVHRDDYDYGPGEDYPNGQPYDLDAVNKAHREQTNKIYAANSTDGRRNSSYAARTRGRAPTRQAVRSNSTARRRRWTQFLAYPGYSIFFGGRPRLQRSMTKLERRPCPRDYKPFDADSDLLNFDVPSPFDKTILYVNIVLWVIMMAGTVLLMAAVYKESAVAVAVWLVSEALLLAVATAAAVATAFFMFGAVPVQVGIVTLLNMAIHLGIDIYLMMVVENYRRTLTAKVEDDEQYVQVIV